MTNTCTEGGHFLGEVREQMALELVKPYRIIKILKDKTLRSSIPGRGKIETKAQSIKSVWVRKIIQCRYSEWQEQRKK